MQIHALKAGAVKGRRHFDMTIYTLLTQDRHAWAGADNRWRGYRRTD